MRTERLPDFVVIGAMKAGSTSLHLWLASQAELWAPEQKEPHFFSQDWVWARGSGWYQGLFDAAPPGVLRFESSTSYSDPEYAEAAARRLHETIPEARLIYVVRHPIDRLRSDYRHSVAEARQDLPLADVVQDLDCGHVRRSMYFSCLAPYRRLFRDDQIKVVAFEALVRPPHAEWDGVIEFLGLSPRPAPGTRHNATDERVSATGVKRFLRRTGLLPFARRLPAGARRLAARAAPVDARTHALLASADDPLPVAVMERIWDDVDALEAWLRRDAPLWQRGSLSAR